MIGSDYCMKTSLQPQGANGGGWGEGGGAWAITLLSKSEIFMGVIRFFETLFEILFMLDVSAKTPNNVF